MLRLVEVAAQPALQLLRERLASHETVEGVHLFTEGRDVRVKRRDDATEGAHLERAARSGKERAEQIEAAGEEVASGAKQRMRSNVMGRRPTSCAQQTLAVSSSSASAACSVSFFGVAVMSP